MTHKLLVAGCSYTSGYAFEDEKNNPVCWANLLGSSLGYSITNVAKTGANNATIFHETINSLLTTDFDLVLVQWTIFPRFNMMVGLETYPVMTMFKDADVNIVGGECVTGKWLVETGKRLLKLHNDHWDVLNVIKYINVLREIQHSRGKKIFFINGLAPWPTDFFNRRDFYKPSDLDSFTYNILRANDRSDTEVFELYNMIHNQYSEYGGIREDLWLNLYNSFDNIKVDTIGVNDLHPGKLSQPVIKDTIYETLIKRL
jgi:hypothetical protein